MAKRRATRTGADGPVPIVLPPNVAALLGAEANDLLEALHRPTPISIRNNPLKPGHLEGTAVPWCTQGRYLDERPGFTLDPRLHAGGYYVQEASSMLLEQALIASGDRGRDLLALDLCAAPGGKSTHLAALLGAGSLLIANEPVPARRRVLVENLWKQGSPRTAIGRGRPEQWAGTGMEFDLIVVDAPCSGEGMFRKDPFARAQWSERLVQQCAQVQEGILRSAWQLLRPGGTLVYSTCTWERAENEEQVLRMVRDEEATLLPLDLRPEWGIERTDAGHRCYPHRVQGEGFFLAVLRKPGTPHVVRHLPGPSTLPPEVAPWLDPVGAWGTTEHEGVLYAVPGRWQATVQHLWRSGLLEHPGVPVAEFKGRERRPHPVLALNTALRMDRFPVLELDRTEVLDYLRGGTRSASQAEGVLLITHAGMPLGWMQGAGNRWNNRWPEAWRIRMR